MEHIENTVLEKLFVCPDELSTQEKDTIAVHIEKCFLCREHAAKLKEFYKDLQANLDSQPAERDKALAEKLLARSRLALPEKKLALQERVDNALSTFVEIIEPYHRPLMQRFVRYIQVHPVRFVGATSLAGFALVAAFLLVKPAFKDGNPAFAKIKDYVLTVYNKEAEVIWTKSVVGIPDGSTVFYQYRNFNENPRRLLVTDIDGDNKNELLLTGSNISKEFAEDTLYCFEYDGNLKWKHGVGPAIAFGKLDFTAYSTWFITNIFIVNNTKTGKPKLFALALQRMYSPSKLFEINPANGSELQSYWHRGAIYSMITMDLDNNGHEEIILGGVNNNFERACVAVLDPDNINGYGLSTPENIPAGINKATEKYYVLLPFTKLGQQFIKAISNCVQEFEIAGKGLFRAYSHEILGIEDFKYTTIIYTFGEGMKIKTLLGDDTFIKHHNKLEKEGKISEHYGPEYLQSLKDSIKYWDGERFVNIPVINKFYLKAKPNP